MRYISENKEINRIAAANNMAKYMVIKKAMGKTKAPNTAHKALFLTSPLLMKNPNKAPMIAKANVTCHTGTCVNMISVKRANKMSIIDRLTVKCSIVSFSIFLLSDVKLAKVY